MIKKFKQGAASFYIVAFSTLILVIIAASFATVMISAVTRSSNDDLSQSAYDAALAGVEDAKLAYSNYRRCLEKFPAYATEDGAPKGPSNSVTADCQDIVYWMNDPDGTVGCDMVGLMVGRIAKEDWRNGQTGEVSVSDTSADIDGTTSNLNQAYTCAKIKTTVSDYRANLSSSAQVKLVKVEFDGNVQLSDITKVKFGWYDIKKNENLNYANFTGGNVTLRPALGVSTILPPVVSLQMVQTADDISGGFHISDFWKTDGGTDRATLYFVPTDNSGAARSNKFGTTDEITTNTYWGIWNGGENAVSAAAVVKTNDQHIKNLPFLTFCDKENNTGEFACSVTIDLPRPYGGATRDNDTFMMLVNLPYGEPDTNFSLTFYKNDGSVAIIKGVQVEIDSTGRANDLYRRVEVRLETTDTSFAYPYYALQMLGSSEDESITKAMTVKKENWGSSAPGI